MYIVFRCFLVVLRVSCGFVECLSVVWLFISVLFLVCPLAFVSRKGPWCYCCIGLYLLSVLRLFWFRVYGSKIAALSVFVFRFVLRTFSSAGCLRCIVRIYVELRGGVFIDVVTLILILSLDWFWHYCFSSFVYTCGSFNSVWVFLQRCAALWDIYLGCRY